MTGTGTSTSSNTISKALDKLVSNADSDKKLDDLITLGNLMVLQATQKRTSLKQAKYPKWCGSVKCKGLDCDVIKCKGCELVICKKISKECDFDGDSHAGCGAYVCDGCYVSPRCGYDDVGGCQECLDKYLCYDCHVCGKQWIP